MSLNPNQVVVSKDMISVADGVAGLDGSGRNKEAPKVHGPEHTDGTDDIQDATALVKGLATPTQISKLDGIEAGATQYTDANAIAAIGKKAGIVPTTAWGAGNPKKTTITFATPYADNDYAVVITGENSRGWSVESKSASGFVINSNSNITPTGNTFWIAMKAEE